MLQPTATSHAGAGGDVAGLSTADPTVTCGATGSRCRLSGMDYMTGPGTQPEETLGALFVNASRDLSALVRSEVELAKSEVRQDLKNGAKGGAMFGAAALLGLLAVIMLSIALAQGLVRLGVVSWLAFLIVAVFYLLVTGVFAMVGKKAVSKVGPPERAIRSSKETAAFLKGARSGNGSSPTT